MSRLPQQKRSFKPRLEAVEARALMSGFANPRQAAIQAFVSKIHRQQVTTDPAGVAAILSALRGGAGSEFVRLVRREVPNLNAVIRSFVNGQRSQFTVPGFAVKTPNFQELYTGPKYDHLAVTAAGALVLNKNRVELAAIMRGPFDEPVNSYVVFGLDRGAGASVGPRFANRPGITPDMTVTIQVGPYGSNPTGTITDLTTGATTSIDPARISVAGPTIRVFLDANQIPSTGLKIARYRFDMWTQNTLGGLETVGSFAPEMTMIRVGTQGRR